MKYIKILLLFIVVQVSAQQGGMWIPSLLNGMNEQEMTALGSKLTAKDIYNVMTCLRHQDDLSLVRQQDR